MKHIFTLVFTFTSMTIMAQTPQIARVSSNGTTTVYTDIKKAVSEAQDDDFIYLPGGQFNVDSLIFKKRINIIGTGHYPDSTLATGSTLINGNVYCFGGGSGGSLQGVALTNGGNVNYGSTCKNFTISKCRFGSVQTLSSDMIDNSLTSILNIRECIVSGSLSNGGDGFSISASNSILGSTLYCNYSVFTNCTVIWGGLFSPSNPTFKSYNEFRNCIIRLSSFQVNYGSNNRFFNCHSIGVTLPNLSDAFFNSTNDAGDGSLTFQGGAMPANFDYSFDYRVLSSSPAAGSGTDGTDRGIYGSLHPYDPTPYNPHVYYKDIAPTTNAQGQLQISVKAKAQ